jgi:membrane protein
MPDSGATPGSSGPARASGALAVLRFMARRMAADRIAATAASLSFTSTLAIVPALAVVLAILTAFPAFENVRAQAQDFILGNLVPDTGLKMREQMEGFIQAAGRLTAFGVIGLAITSILLLLTIETSFNEIFKVRRPRPLLTRLLVLWAVITVGPFLFGLSFVLFGAFATSQSWLGADAAQSMALVLGEIAPTLVAWLAFGFLYLVVPNRRVLVRDALIGAAVAAVAFGLLRYGFAAFVASMTSYQAIYGAVAAVPVFLVWVYLNWILVLAGAVIAAALPDWRHARDGRSDGTLDRLALALEIVARLAAAQAAGGAIPARRLAKTLAAPDVAVGQVLETLRQNRFVAMTDDGGWMLARDLERIALADVVHGFGLGLDVAGLAGLALHGEAAKRLAHHLARAAESERTLLSVTLSKIVTVADAPPAPASEPSAS